MGVLTSNTGEADQGAEVFHFPTSKSLLLIFTKNPIPGKCKTRLAKDVGDEIALDIYRFLLHHTESVSRQVKADRWVYYSDAIVEDDLWDGHYYTKMLQKGADLGSKMHHAFEDGFGQGYQKIVIIGSDLYDLKSDDIDAAFEALNTNDIVLGPAEDGGYYLLGMKKPHPTIFADKEWGTNTVLETTLDSLQGEKWVLLDVKNDIDTLEDIRHHQAFQHFLQKIELHAKKH